MDHLGGEHAMLRIKSLIKTEAEYQMAVTRIERLMSLPRSPEATDELELLSALVELYEEQHHPVLPPDPIVAIKFRMEQMGLKRSDLEPLIGSRARVAEVLNRRRPLWPQR